MRCIADWTCPAALFMALAISGALVAMRMIADAALLAVLATAVRIAGIVAIAVDKAVIPVTDCMT